MTERRDLAAYITHTHYVITEADAEVGACLPDLIAVRSGVISVYNDQPGWGPA